ncbi:MAG TPA: ferredoxin--nitrite reductase [Dehalococcoidia bacterium]|nr:ferredoxin--nitrite reductase [Dehalococcoidia bacterium]
MGNRIEEIKRAKDGLDVLPDIYRYARLGFDAVDPDDLERMKWYGLFHRRQTPGFFMMRLRIPNGILTSRQMAALGDIVNRYGRGRADLTTRQNIQLRWVRIEDVPAIFETLREIGVAHLQTGMDNVRNVTGCPIAGLDPEEALDASPLTRAIQEAILGRKEFSNLPRKFNICVTGCRRDCSLSQTHDIGLTPASREGALGFNVRVGGAMGGKSTHLSWELDVFVRPEETVEVCRAIVALFRDEGPRDNRQQARLRWLVEAWGVPRFRAAVEERLGRPLARAGRDEVISYGGDHLGVRPQKQAGLCYVGCLVPVGRITGDELREFARLAQTYGDGELRLTQDQNVLLVNVPRARVPALLDEPLLRRFTPFPPSSLRRLVSCTGNDYCHFSLIDTKGRALQIAERLEALLPKDRPLRMHWSGCPHACGQHHIADIGFQAARVRVNGEVVDAADVYIGGRLGNNPRLATKALEGVPLSELPEHLKTLLEDGLLSADDEAASKAEESDLPLSEVITA